MDGSRSLPAARRWRPFGTLDNVVKFAVRLFGGSVLDSMLNPTRAVLEQRDMTEYVL